MATKTTQDSAPLQRELIVMADAAAEMRARGAGVASLSGMDVSPLEDVLARAGATARAAATSSRVPGKTTASGARPSTT